MIIKLADLAREMAEKIAKGRLNKFFKETTLLNQAFIRDNKKYDIVYGKRKFGLNMPFLRILSNLITSFIISLYCQKKIKDSPAF